MLFSEIYGTYFNAVAEILKAAVEGTLTERTLTETVQRVAFGESVLTIPARLREESWPLLTKDLHTPLRHTPTMPLTILQKQWLKALLNDPRIRLFSPSDAGLEDVEPLFTLDTFVYFDRYADGDPFGDADYIAHFRTVLQALKEKRKLRIRFRGHTNIRHSFICTPHRLEYSAKDDKFRLLAVRNGQLTTVNIARIRSCELREGYTPEEYTPVEYRERGLTLLLTDERNALERAMLHFSDLEKETAKLDDTHYRITLSYKADDETEILIRVLSFGPMLRVLEPQSFVELVRERLNRQFALQNEQNAKAANSET